MSQPLAASHHPHPLLLLVWEGSGAGQACRTYYDDGVMTIAVASSHACSGWLEARHTHSHPMPPPSAPETPKQLHRQGDRHDFIQLTAQVLLYVSAALHLSAGLRASD